MFPFISYDGSGPWYLIQSGSILLDCGHQKTLDVENKNFNSSSECVMWLGRGLDEESIKKGKRGKETEMVNHPFIMFKFTFGVRTS